MPERLNVLFLPHPVKPSMFNPWGTDVVKAVQDRHNIQILDYDQPLAPQFKSIDAVIDKDRASSLLAQTLRADLLLISTGVEKVCLHFNSPDEYALDVMTLQEAHRYMDEEHFARGSMFPKIEAAVDFVHNGGPRAIITNPANLTRALRHETGPWIVPGG